MWIIFKVFIEFCTVLFLFYVLVFWPWGVGDLSYPSRDRTFTPCAGRESFNHWTTREIQWLPVKIVFMSESVSCLVFVISSCLPGSSAGKESACNEGDLGSIPGLGRCPGEGNGYPLQDSGLENSTDCKIHGVGKNWTRLSSFQCETSET